MYQVEGISLRIIPQMMKLHMKSAYYAPLSNGDNVPHVNDRGTTTLLQLTY